MVCNNYWSSIWTHFQVSSGKDKVETRICQHTPCQGRHFAVGVQKGIEKAQSRVYNWNICNVQFCADNKLSWTRPYGRRSTVNQGCQQRHTGTLQIYTSARHTASPINTVQCPAKIVGHRCYVDHAFRHMHTDKYGCLVLSRW